MMSLIDTRKKKSREMLSLALSSLRFRISGFAASFINVCVGATVLMAFASLFDSATGPRVSASDKNTLVTMALVIGGWGILIVAFGVAATLNLSVRQRSTEIALLKSVGATPSQVSRMITGETAIVSGVAAVVAIPFAFLAGRALLAALAATHQVAGGINYHFGFAALGFGLGDTLIASALASYVTARRASKLNPRAALVSAEVDNPGLGRKRFVAGFLCLGIGISCATLITTFFRNRGFLSESIAGEAGIWTAIGLALFAPLLMRASGSLLGFPLRKSSAASEYLANINIRQRASQMAGVLMPVILFTGIGAGGLYMQSILNTANASEHIVDPTANKAVETLNFVVIAMIAVFAAVVLTNIAIATTLHRRREFGQQRLTGSTPPQVLWMVAIETLVTAITGLVFGTVAAFTTIVPFSIAVAHTALPHVGPGIYIGVVVTVFVLTFLANMGASQRAIQLPILDAISTGS